MNEVQEAALVSVLQRRRALEARKDKIASMAIEAFQPNWEWPSSSQLQGLRTAATGTDSVEEVKIFIKYQIGRKQIDQEFGDALVKKSEELQNEAGEGDPKLAIEMVRHFLGNVVRYGKFKEFLKKEEQEKAKKLGRGGR